MNPLREQFVTEARELIQQAIEDLLALEREGDIGERVDRVFRAFHTLKGAAGVVELPAMGLTLHAAEDLLAAIQSGRVELSSLAIDRALACLDLVSAWVDAFESDETLPPRAGEDAVAMKEQLDALISGSTAKPAETAAKMAADGQAPWITRLIEDARRRMQGETSRHGQFAAVSYEPRADCFFNGDDPLATMRKLPNLVALRVEAREPWPAVAEIDPYSCNLRFQALAATGLAELAPLFRLVPDQVRMVEIPAGALSGEKAKGAEVGAPVSTIIDEQLRMLRSMPAGEDFAGRAGSAARAASNALRQTASGRALAEDLERARASSVSAMDATPLLAALEKVLAVLTSGTPGTTGTPPEAGAQGPERAASRSMRVDESKIEALGNLAGELIVLKNAIAHLAKRVEDELPGRDLARAVRREADAMERLSAGLHGAILELRMVPVAGVLRRFPRLVRDMAQRLGKKIDLITEGETTEADKALVDVLFEPLMHLVRNAMDHGVEPPAHRQAAGKPETARITIRAARAGRRFIVEVADDGRGIDPAAIKRRARERRLLPEDELDGLSDEQAIELIFSAGFSTATEVSDVSGRGVGMDVVRATVQRMEGRVSVSSTIGQGTMMRLDLPANVALSRVMVVEAGGQVFGIPMDAVSETLRLAPDRITRIKNNAGFVLRDRIVPIHALAEAMSLPVTPAADSAPRLLIVTETGGRLAGLEVDAIRDRLDVMVKPLQGVLSQARSYAGTALLGDGRVLLVLDLKEVLA